VNEIDAKTFDRRTFIDRYMKEGGLTYSQACRLHTVTCNVFEEAIITGSKVTIGRVGAIVPCWRSPREIQMHFRRTGQKVEKGVHRTFFMDGRYEFKFRLYRRFLESRNLKWMVDMPVSS
jgi:hypothetical protein